MVQTRCAARLLGAANMTGSGSGQASFLLRTDSGAFRRATATSAGPGGRRPRAATRSALDALTSTARPRRAAHALRTLSLAPQTPRPARSASCTRRGVRAALHGRGAVSRRLHRHRARPVVGGSRSCPVAVVRFQAWVPTCTRVATRLFVLRTAADASSWRSSPGDNFRCWARSPTPPGDLSRRLGL